MHLQDLPPEIRLIILDYKAEFDRILRFQAFYNHIMHILQF